jgi:imidazolonepropionase-like amidohydrolase
MRAAIVVLGMLCSASAFAQSETEWLLHKMERRIGEERLRVVGGKEPVLRSSFVFSDRGTRVPLAAELALGADGLPRRLKLWGQTSRISEIDLDITVTGGRAVIRDGKKSSQASVPAVFFTVGGYAPMAVKEAMLAAWHRHGRPASMALLPAGTVTITRQGTDTFEVDGKKVTLERLSLGGIKWGRELAWIDDQRRLVAVVTNDAEFSHFEVVRRGYESILDEVVALSGKEGMAALALPPLREGRYAITGLRLVDGTGGKPLENASIVIEGGKILSAGTAPIPPGIPVLDGKGKTALPGLWDMHAHFEQVEWGPIYLAAGVTTVRDAGNTLSFLAGLRGAALAPRVLCAGFLDGKNGDAMGKLQIASEKDIAPVVAQIKAAGCTQVKIYSFVAPALVAPIAKEAHRQGLAVTGHVPNGMKVREAVAAGYDLVSHIHYVADALDPVATPPTSRKERLTRMANLDVDGAAARSLFKLLAQKKVVIDDTIVLYDLLTFGGKSEPGLAKVVPELRAILETFGPSPSTPADEVELSKQAQARWVALIGALHRAGVILVAGTDQSVPGHSLHRQLEIYVAAGLTPLEAIQAATIVPARVMKLDKELGTLTAGKRADLILVDGDPLADIKDIRKVSVVVTGGRAYETAKLWPLAGFTP